MPNEVYAHALRLLRVRDYSVAKLREKLESWYGEVPESVIDQLIRKKFLDDRRFAENYATKWSTRSTARLRQELIGRGVPHNIVEEIVPNKDSRSLQRVLKAKMEDWNLTAPLDSRDAARLFRALVRLGYEEDAIREEVEHLHEQQ